MLYRNEVLKNNSNGKKKQLNVASNKDTNVGIK